MEGLNSSGRSGTLKLSRTESGELNLLEVGDKIIAGLGEVRVLAERLGAGAAWALGRVEGEGTGQLLASLLPLPRRL